MQDYNKRNEDLNANGNRYLVAYTILSLLLIIVVLISGKSNGWIALIIFALGVECVFYLQNKIVAIRNEMKRMEDAEHVKDSFMANLSHEIRTPLNAICGMSEMLVSEGHTGKTGEALYNILAAVRRLE